MQWVRSSKGRCIPCVVVRRLVLEGVAAAVEQLGADAELVARQQRLGGRRGAGAGRGAGRGLRERAQRVVAQHRRAG